MADGERKVLNTVSHMDIFDLCDCLDDNSIDMILCDLPYAVTQNKWDVLIPFEPMWEQFKRIIKPRGAIVLTASQPFTSQLVMSNLEWFRYEWIWCKQKTTRFLDANKRPLLAHENIAVFADGQTVYNAQGVKVINKVKSGRKNKSGRGNYGHVPNPNYIQIMGGYPNTLVKIDIECQGTQHPTQKPVALFEYLIRTYTQPGEVVFDGVVGSGTTAIAARNTGRNYIVGDSSAEYVAIARKRLSEPYTVPMFEEAVKEDSPVQAAMGLE